MNEKICRLCLQAINENFQAIGETLKNILNLNLGVSKETVMCVECTNNFQVFLNLKSACTCIRERTSLLPDMNNDVSSDLVKIENTDDIKPFIIPKNEVSCSFCTKATGDDLISLLESKENMFLVDMIKKYISEVNLRNTEHLLICETCLDGMQNVFCFINKCLDVEEKINKYIEIEGTDGEGQVKLQDVQQFIFKPTLKSKTLISELEETYSQIREDYGVKTETEIKHDKELVDLELSIKGEGIDIKSEHSDDDSFQEPATDIMLDSDPLEIPLYKCEICPYNTKYKAGIKQHILIHKSPSEIRKFKCEICTYETKRRDTLTKHELIHKSPSEVTMFKCELCKFETKHKYDIKRHLLHIHKKSSVVTTLYKCEFCTYETIDKQYLNRHKLIHKSPSEVTMAKCEMCDFETKRKNALNIHMLTHKNASEVTLYKCDICTYGTKRKDRLKVHKLSHKSPSEISMFNCGMCTFETKRKSNLKNHMLTHKNPSEVTMYKCEMCSFKTKRKEWIKYHMLVHEKSLRQCEICDYKTKCEGHFKRHMLRHGTSEITI